MESLLTSSKCFRARKNCNPLRSRDLLNCVWLQEAEKDEERRLVRGRVEGL